MTPLLAKRAEHLTERMEDPDCDREKLFRTYEQFSDLNRLLSRWKSLFRAYVAPLAGKKRALRILDIGCGGGDICLKFSDWAGEAGLRIEMTGIDTDPRALEYTRQLALPDNVEFRLARASDLIAEMEQYDVVISNHLLHHLQSGELADLCRQAEALATRLILFNDLRRSAVGLTIFSLTAPLLYRSSYIARDGITSIRRGYTSREIKRVLPPEWQVKKLIPFRLLLLREMSDV